jgi:hypothetical protein
MTRQEIIDLLKVYGRVFDGTSLGANDDQIQAITERLGESSIDPELMARASREKWAGGARDGITTFMACADAAYRMGAPQANQSDSPTWKSRRCELKEAQRACSDPELRKLILAGNLAAAKNLYQATHPDVYASYEYREVREAIDDLRSEGMTRDDAWGLIGRMVGWADDQWKSFCERQDTLAAQFAGTT